MFQTDWGAPTPCWPPWSRSGPKWRRTAGASRPTPCGWQRSSAWPTRYIETIRLGALLHDVGKLLTPSRILEKPGRPNAREWQELKIHPELGCEICHRSGFDDDVLAIVLHHHERCDGSGLSRPPGDPCDSLHGADVSRDGHVRRADQFARLPRPAVGAPPRARSSRGRREPKFCPWVVSGLLALPVEMLQPARHDDRGPVRTLEGPAVLPMAGLLQFERPLSGALQASLC